MPVAECVADTRAEDRERGYGGNGHVRPGAIYIGTPRRAAGERCGLVAA